MSTIESLCVYHFQMALRYGFSADIGAFFLSWKNPNEMPPCWLWNQYGLVYAVNQSPRKAVTLKFCTTCGTIQLWWSHHIVVFGSWMDSELWFGDVGYFETILLQCPASFPHWLIYWWDHQSITVPNLHFGTAPFVDEYVLKEVPCA